MLVFWAHITRTRRYIPLTAKFLKSAMLCAILMFKKFLPFVPIGLSSANFPATLGKSITQIHPMTGFFVFRFHCSSATPNLVLSRLYQSFDDVRRTSANILEMFYGYRLFG